MTMVRIGGLVDCKVVRRSKCRSSSEGSENKSTFTDTLQGFGFGKLFFGIDHASVDKMRILTCGGYIQAASHLEPRSLQALPKRAARRLGEHCVCLLVVNVRQLYNHLPWRHGDACVALDAHSSPQPTSQAILGKETEAKTATKFNFALFFPRVRNCGCTTVLLLYCRRCAGSFIPLDSQAIVAKEQTAWPNKNETKIFGSIV